MDALMQRAEGLVIRVESGYALVQLRRQGGCGRCGEPGGCGIKDDSARACSEYRLENACAAQPGQRVAVVLPEGQTLLAALLAYGFPLLTTLLVAALGTLLGWPELAVAAAVLVALLGCAGAVYCLRRRGWLPVARPYISRVLS
jgi:sigma-E factor negative regulatory protein RseC